MTVDLEYDWTGSERVDGLKRDLPKILELFDKHNITATFFTVGKLAEQHPEIIDKIKQNHEIASHTHLHNNNDLDAQIVLSKKVFKSFKIKLKGFRCFGFQMPENLGEILAKHSFIYDSSVACGVFPGRFNNIFGISNPYKASVHNLKEQGSGIIEFPIPSLIPPLFMSGFSYYKMIYPVSKALKLPYLFYFHPNDLSAEKPAGEYGNFLIKSLMMLHSNKAWQILETVFKTENDWVGCEKWMKLNKIK